MARLFKAIIAVVLAFGLVAASSSSHSVFTLTFERPLENVTKVKETLERLARVSTPTGGFMAMEVKAIGVNRFTVSYLQGRPGCSSAPEVDGAASAIESVKKVLETAYGPVRIEQQHRANSGATAP